MSINPSTGLYTADEGSGTYAILAEEAGIVGRAYAEVAAGWNTSINLAPPLLGYAGIAANGETVHVVSGSGTTYYRRSADEGDTWGSWVNLGSGTPYLDHPLAVDAAGGTTVGLATIGSLSNITDFYGVRPVGEISIRRSTNDGVTWSSAVQITSGAKALRLSLAISGSNWFVVWMDWRASGSGADPTYGTWDLKGCRSSDNGATWGSVVTLVLGTNKVGAERPGLTADGDDFFIAWMDGRDNHAACTIEGGYLLAICTEVYTKRSTDGAATWEADEQRTLNPSYYSGRPDIAAKDGKVVVSCDQRPTSAGNEISSVASGDGGDSWSAVQLITSTAGDSTHSYLAHSSTPGRFYAAWNDTRSGVKHNWLRITNDGAATWSPEEQISEDQASIPFIHESTNYLHGIWGKQSDGTLQYRRRTR